MGTITVRKKSNPAITAQFSELAWANIKNSKATNPWEEIPGEAKKPSALGESGLPDEILKKKAELTAKLKEDAKTPVLSTSEITGNKTAVKDPVKVTTKKATEKKTVKVKK